MNRTPRTILRFLIDWVIGFAAGTAIGTAYGGWWGLLALVIVGTYSLWCFADGVASA